MDQPDLNWIANFIWGIADDVLRDLYVRRKHRDVILPMTVLRRLDALLEPKELVVLETKRWLDSAGITKAGRFPMRRCGVSPLQHAQIHLARPAGGQCRNFLSCPAVLA